MNLLGPRSVDQIMQGFTKVVDELNKAATRLDVRIESCEDAIEAAQAEKRNAVIEKERASAAAKNLNKLLGIG